jgi:hypothetical protein
MKMILVSAFALALTIIALAALPRAAGQQSSDSAKANHDSPLACNRLALTPEQRKRHFEELGPTLRSLKTGVRELPDGFEFKFPADMKTYQLVAEWTAGERVCCPFFDINLRSEREGGPLWLRLTGRDGVKQFIQAEGATWLKPGGQ